ncbi:U3 small nucleolar RNA-associated protein 19 [Strigomonas culicis]|uniref:U3 small nucleolar RNA-associated protein 19 n=1 Tax=Strigomonas culicis TaxID=28005 RepID=S9VY37_9TRYP|nr:U3 small nucleolar RNA-associated protein 19 [Strigomonas culicis]|eukprot:EPY31986.1 U3 small nucleolar RNA-associated protein 19 [Strigomonas culicis]
MEEAFDAALLRCDKCKTFSDLVKAFDAHVRPLLERQLRAPLVREVRDHITPDECCPATAQLRAHLEGEASGATDDVWFLLLRCASQLMERERHGGSGGAAAELRAPQKRPRAADDADDGARPPPVCDATTVLLVNCFVLFSNRSLPDLKHLTLRWSFLKKEKARVESSDDYVSANVAERRKLLLSHHSVLSLFSERAHKHYFTTVWMTFMSSAAATALHIHILYRLGSFVLRHLTNPLLLADYLTDCFRSGGLVSVLALHGLFLLMVDHGLEYPQFYHQLYSLITADNFASRHRYDLFRLLHLSMTSVRLSAYIAASVIKRVARVALLAPAPTLYFVLPFIRQLLQAHPNCLALIHRSSREAVVPEEEATAEAGEDTERPLKRAAATPNALAARQRALRETALLFEGKDPFVMTATDPAETHALHSTLWELTALERHFLPAVPLMVGAYGSTAEDKTPLQFEKSYARLFTSEVTRPIDKRHMPTVAYRPPEMPAADSVLLL